MRQSFMNRNQKIMVVKSTIILYLCTPPKRVQYYVKAFGRLVPITKEQSLSVNSKYVVKKFI